jgi:hypothetical protein
MGIQRAAGVVLIIGSIIFIIAAFGPDSRVFVEPDPARKLEIMEKGRTQWTISQVLFGLGASVTAIGLGLAAYLLRRSPAAPLAWLGFVAVAVGAILWDWHVLKRALDPAAFAHGTLPLWQFTAYTLLTVAGLAAFGVVYLRVGFPAWLGVVTVAGAAVLFVLFLVFKDMPPFVYYILTILTGIVMFWSG